MHCRSTFLAAAAVFLLVLALGGCGAEAPVAGSATVEVASLPTGQVWVDGVERGTTPLTLTLGSGSHELTIKQDGFADHASKLDLASGATEKVDVALVVSDAENPAALARLASAYEIEIEPFEAPEQHRGKARSEPAILLWPHKDVRLSGLTTFAIEAGEAYDGTMRLEFRDGKEVLYSEAFDPETSTTVGSIPQAVLDHVKPGSKITWGLFNADSNKGAIKGTFEVVNHPKADRKLEKLASDRAVARQSAIVRELLVAKTLENYRLYTEALIKGLEIIDANPDSTQPYQGIVSVLRRMDGEGSRLWTVASQFVSGAGRNRTSATNGGLQGLVTPTMRTSPVGSAPPIASNEGGGGKVQGPAGAVTPRDAYTGDGSPVTTPDASSGADAPTGGSGTPPAGGVGPAAPPTASAAIAQRAAEKAEDAARRASEANAAVDAAQAALEAATAAVDANPGDPEAMARADEARHAMDAALQAAQQAADVAQNAANVAADAAARAAQERDALPGSGPGTGPLRPGESGAAEFAQRAADKATAAARLASQTSAAQQAAQAALEAATAAVDANPGDPEAMARADEARHAMDAALFAAQEAADAAELAARVAEAAAAAAAAIPQLPGSGGSAPAAGQSALEKAIAKADAAVAAQAAATAALAGAQAAFDAAAAGGDPAAMEAAQRALDVAHANRAAADEVLNATLEGLRLAQER